MDNKDKDKVEDNKEQPKEKEKEKVEIKIIDEKNKEIKTKEIIKEIKLDEDKDEKDEKDDKEDKDDKEEDGIYAFSDKENIEENEENEDNEDNDNNEDDNNENDNDDDQDEEQEEDEDQENSDKNEEEMEEENENDIEEENNIKEENNPKKEKEKEKADTEIKEVKDKDKEKEKDKDKEKEDVKEKKEPEKKEEKELAELKFDPISEKELDFNEMFNKRLEKINEEIIKGREKLKEKLLSRKRRLETDEYLHKKKYYFPPKTLDNKSLQEKIKELLDNYLTEEKIQQYLSLDENKEKINLIKIKETLTNYYNEIFSSTNTLEEKENIIKKILDILLNENISITLFELETSKILLSLCHFFGPEFISIYNQLKDDNSYKNIDELVNDLKERNIIPEKKDINNNIFHKLSKFFDFFKDDKKKILKFISLLNESILGMNNTIINLYEKRPSYLLLNDTLPSIDININYDDQIFKDKVLKENIIKDESFKTKLCELNMFFFNNKRLRLSLNNNTTFKNMGIILLATANIPLISNDKHDISFEFYVEVKKEKKSEDKKEDKGEDKMIIEKEKNEKENNMDEEEDIINSFNEDNDNDEIMEEVEDEEIKILNINKEKEKLEQNKKKMIMKQKI